jgi:peptide-methionine (R)-S-oxide reductase
MALNKETPDVVWKERLTPFEYTVLREKGTEPRHGEYDSFYPKPGEGHFACRGCGKPLYSAESKFKSGCGWPAFDKCFKGSVETTEDVSHGMRRIEITCAGCGGHLGHGALPAPLAIAAHRSTIEMYPFAVFVGEGMTQTNERHCVNSPSIKFVNGASAKLEEEIVAAK